MKVHELSLSVFLLQDLHKNWASEQIAELLDKSFVGNEELQKMHKVNRYKPYTFNNLYPLESDKVYKAGKIYTILIRTSDERLVTHWKKHLMNTYTDVMKALVLQDKVLPNKVIACVYTMTPAIIKTDEGYWRGHMSFEEYKEVIRLNMINKYKYFTGQDISDDAELFTRFELKNKTPLKFQYKGVTLLGDKLQIEIAGSEEAQRVAHCMLGLGVGGMNARGAGFLTYRTY